MPRVYFIIIIYFSYHSTYCFLTFKTTNLQDSKPIIRTYLPAIPWEDDPRFKYSIINFKGVCYLWQPKRLYEGISIGLETISTTRLFLWTSLLAKILTSKWRRCRGIANVCLIIGYCKYLLFTCLFVSIFVFIFAFS